MNRLVISEQYGQLIEGLQRTQRELTYAIAQGEEGVERARFLLAERQEWIEAMRRASLFVGAQS